MSKGLETFEPSDSEPTLIYDPVWYKTHNIVWINHESLESVRFREAHEIPIVQQSKKLIVKHFSILF